MVFVWRKAEDLREVKSEQAFHGHHNWSSSTIDDAMYIHSSSKFSCFFQFQENLKVWCLSLSFTVCRCNLAVMETIPTIKPFLRLPLASCISQICAIFPHDLDEFLAEKIIPGPPSYTRIKSPCPNFLKIKWLSRRLQKSVLFTPQLRHNSTGQVLRTRLHRISIQTPMLFDI